MRMTNKTTALLLAGSALFTAFSAQADKSD